MGIGPVQELDEAMFESTSLKTALSYTRYDSGIVKRNVNSCIGCRMDEEQESLNTYDESIQSI